MTKNLLAINIVRNGKLKITLEVCDEIKAFYKNLNPDVREASFGKFAVNSKTTILYQKQGDDSSLEYNRYIRGNELLDDTSESYLSDFSHVNLAFLRIASAYDTPVTIELPRVISEDTLKDYTVKLKDVVVAIYKKFIRPVRINCTLSYEEVV